MSVTRRDALRLGGAAAFAIAAPTVLRAQQKITLRVAHATSTQSTYSFATNYFGQRIEELTEGRIAVREFAGGILGSETTSIDLYGEGDIDMGFHLNSAMAPAVREMAFLDSAFMFDSLDHWKNFAYSEAFRETLNGYLAGHKKPYRMGMVGLGGARSIYTSSKIISSLEDFRGFRIRLPESPVAGRVWRELGSIPTAVPWPDTYAAIETGLVEGGENTPNWYVDSRHIEVAKQFHWTNHLIGTIICLIGDRTMQRVPEELHPQLRQALAETSEAWLAETVAADQKAVSEVFEAQNVVQHHLPAETVARIQEVAQSLAAGVAEEFGATRMLDLIREAA